MKKPLAFRLRPQSLDEISGQKHLIGPDGLIRRCLEQESFFSCIFFGPPGIGKTTLAEVIAKELKVPYRFFNAVTGNKKDLDAIFLEAKLANQLILICDEVHRLNKDKQDLLLPHIEDGSVILIGATTANPYFAINPAIRSRCQLLELKPLSKEDVKETLIRALKAKEGLDNQYTIEEQALEYISQLANGDLRYALNLLEVAAILTKDGQIKVTTISKHCQVSNQRTFSDEDGYYNLLSAFQKAIRGSDPDAALYYLALLIQSGDLASIVRRLLVIAYEDIGLANPPLVARTYNACQSAIQVGLPEAVIPLGSQVIDLALAPKSRTAHDAAFKALDLVNNKAYDIPDYLHLNPVGLDKDATYSYDRYDCFHKIQYLPDEIKNISFFESFNNNRYEQLLQATYQELKKQPRTANLKKLYSK